MKILILGTQARYEAYLPPLPFIRQQELVFRDKAVPAETLAREVPTRTCCLWMPLRRCRRS